MMASASKASLGSGHPPPDERAENRPSDKERVLLASETLTGAKWLLVLASQALDGSQTLRAELHEVKRVHEMISALCKRLSRADTFTI